MTDENISEELKYIATKKKWEEWDNGNPKTLKELPKGCTIINPMSKDQYSVEHTADKFLRAEAILWVKHWEDMGNYEAKDGRMTSENRMSLRSMQMAFKRFFNLKKKDLK